MVRRGMTFLEIVAATALLAVVAAAVFGTLGFTLSSGNRDLQTLGAMEVANRLVLAYLDDPYHMPDSTKTVQYGAPEAPMLFRWELKEEPVALIEVAADQRDTSRSSPLSKDRFRQVTVHTWLSEQSGGSRYPDASTPAATLSRMMDPVAPRNADSFMNMVQSPEGFQGMINTMMGFQNGTVIRGGGQQNQQGGGRGQFRPGPIGGGDLGARQAFQNGRRGFQGGQQGGFFNGLGNRFGRGPG